MSIAWPQDCRPDRRSLLKFAASGAALLATGGLAGLAAAPAGAVAAQSDAWIIGPQPGFTPEIGTLVSMLAFTRKQVLHNAQGLSTADLDFLLDSKANTIGALLHHLAATDAFYHANVFGGFAWDKMPDSVSKPWGVAMNLGEPARQTIKGKSLDYYLNLLQETREKTLAELKKRDDKWLAVVDSEAGANNFAKWFHVAEHESNHDGQIKFLKGRLPGGKPAGE